MAMHMKDVTPYTWQTPKICTGTCLAMYVEDGGMERIQGMGMEMEMESCQMAWLGSSMGFRYSR
jgi:hypothetical protein